MVGMSVPPLSGGGRYGPDHQSQAVLPGLIHEVSKAAGGFRLPMRLDSISLPSLSAIMMTRHGDPAPSGPMGVRAINERSSSRREMRDCTPGLPSPRPPRYMPP